MNDEYEYRKALRKNATNLEALLGLGKLALRRGAHKEALEYMRRCVALHPTKADAHFGLGLARQAEGEYVSALASYQAALSVDNRYFLAHYQTGVVRSLMAAPVESVLEAFTSSTEIEPRFEAGYLSQFDLLRILNRHDEALDVIERAFVFIAPATGALLRARARAKLMRADFLGALSDLDVHYSLEPNNVEAQNLRGIVFQKLERFDDALLCFALAQSLDSQFASAHWNEAICRLTMGDWSRRTWEKYEWGWALGERQPKRSFAQTLWTGEQSLAGQTILLHDEQGLGDTLQFSRFASVVASLGARVILQVQPPLKLLMQDLDDRVHVVADGEPLPAFDLHCPLLSVPLALQLTVDSIPTQRTQLRPQTSYLERWGRRVNELGLKGLKVGIVWSGNTSVGGNHLRSISLRELLSIRPHSVSFVSLQQTLKEEEAALLEAAGVPDLGRDFCDFSDTAAAVANLDLVISVCTSVAHLVGSMGLPCWILLSRTHCWRWLREPNATPWYPSARIFRQAQSDVWSDVLAEAARELELLGTQRVPMEGGISLGDL